MLQRKIPYSLLMEQRHHIVTVAQTTMLSALPLFKKPGDSTDYVSLEHSIEAPRSSLIAHYLDWARVPRSQQNTHRVPAHMFSQWSVPFATRVLIQNGFGLTNIVNIGSDIKVKGSIRRGEELFLYGEIVKVDESAHRTHITVRIVTATKREAEAIEAHIHCMLPKTSLSDPSLNIAKSDRHWETAGAWSVDRNDGLRFALLTGDFNPVHWIDYAARQSPFGQVVLHGFASLSLSWVALQARQSQNHSIRNISCRFIRPVPLPSASMYVLRSPLRASGARRFSVRNPQGMVYVFGEYS